MSFKLWGMTFSMTSTLPWTGLISIENALYSLSRFAFGGDEWIGAGGGSKRVVEPSGGIVFVIDQPERQRRFPRGLESVVRHRWRR